MNSESANVLTIDIGVIKEFLFGNWASLMLIIVGASALLVYILQERKKETEAASVVIQQIDELQERIKEIQSFIVNDQLSETAFYESQIILDENYWNKYKHYFVRKMGSKSYRSINSLYEYALEIKEQQLLMKNLQKNFFFVKQQAFLTLETHYIVNDLANSMKNPIDMKAVISAIPKMMPNGVDEEQRRALENIIRQQATFCGDINFDMFWKMYSVDRENIRIILDKQGVTFYTPLQIKVSLEKALRQYALLEIAGSEGYRRLQKIANRTI